jgi:hypothetical protein
MQLCPRHLCITRSAEVLRRAKSARLRMTMECAGEPDEDRIVMRQMEVHNEAPADPTALPDSDPLVGQC